MDVNTDERAEREFFIAAAQLRMVTDRRLGKVTPEWVKQLADEKIMPELPEVGSATKLPHVERSVEPAMPARTATTKSQRVQITAAKLRVALDARLGRVTPESVKKLAAENY